MHNVGSIFRTADAAGAKKIFLCGITPGPLDKYGRPNTQLTKVSLGAEDTVEWQHRESTLELVNELKSSGKKIYAVELHPDAIDYREVECDEASEVVLIMGGEVTGISSELLAYSDAILKIPMLGKKESLNVSVAFGIIVYQFVPTHI